MAARGMVAASVERSMCQDDGFRSEFGRWWLPTLEGGLLGNVERRGRPAHGVLSVASTWSAHLVEGGDAVSDFEFGDAFADRVDGAGDVVALVEGSVGHLRKFPE